MGRWDAFDRVDREHPELTGNDRLRAIRALRQEEKAARRRGKKAGTECAACHEVVKPVEPTGLALLFACVMLLALASVVGSLVAAVHPFSDATVHGGWAVVLWPVAAVQGWTHPRPLAVLLALAAAWVASSVQDKLNNRARRKARCPRCTHPMPIPPKPAA